MSARGLVVGHLKESRSQLIVVGDYTLCLRDGVTCEYPVGTKLEVAFTVVDGIKLVDTIAKDR